MNSSDLEKSKQTPESRIIEHYRSILSATTVFNIIGLIVLIYEQKASIIAVIAGLIAFFTALKSVRMVYKNHIYEGKILAIINLVFASLLILINLAAVILFVWSFTILGSAFSFL